MRKPGLYAGRFWAGNAADYDRYVRKLWKRYKGDRRGGIGLAAAWVFGILGFFLVLYAIGSAVMFPVRLAEKAVQPGEEALENETDARGLLLTGGEILLEFAREKRMPAEALGDDKLIPKRIGEIVVVLDPGHGGVDTGCLEGGVKEKDINLQIASSVRQKLQRLGYRAVLTRESDAGLSLQERVEMARKHQADLYVSIHQNASEEASAEGIEVLYSAENEGADSSRLASLIQKYILEESGAAKRNLLEEEGLYVIRECTMPSCLVETGFLTNAKERERLKNPEYQAQLADGIVSGIELFFHPKTMYLTFDDGPSEKNTAAILDILKERNIKATFFLVGENVRKHPEVAKRIAMEGHTIGIHCDSHEYRSLYASVDSYLEDFQRAYDTVKEVTGVEAKLFRFPGGSINAYDKKVYEEIAQAMEDRGFLYYDWNASLEDATSQREPEVLIENAVSSTLGRKKVVMLAHDVIYETSQCLDELLDQFPEYQMKPLTENEKPIQF